MVDAAREADPLELDSFFQRSLPVSRRPADELLERLAAVVREVDPSVCSEPVAGLAALRDLDFLLCSVHRARPAAYKEVTGLEELLGALGEAAGHNPRGSNTTYALCNPLDQRMRLFTGLPEERMFINELAAGLRGLDHVLHGLIAIVDHGVDSAEAAAAAETLVPAWEPMIGATVAMLRSMPPEVFSGEIMTSFIPLDIAGTEYQGVTGAQNLNIGIDWLLWGAGSTSTSYTSYARTNLSEQLPAHIDLIANVLDRTRGATLLDHLERQLRHGPVADWAAADRVLLHLEGLLRRIGSFRAAHRRLADLNLPLRYTPTGSGGHTIDLLDELADATRQARQRVQALRDLVRERGGSAVSAVSAVSTDAAAPPPAPRQRRAGDQVRPLTCPPQESRRRT